MKNALLLLSIISWSFSTAYAQNYDIEYEESGIKLAIKDLKTGKLISKFIFDEVEIFEHHGIIRRGKKYGLFDVDSGKIYPCKYEQIGEFDSLNSTGQKAIVKKNGKEGVMALSKENGLETILPFKYNRIEIEFSYPFHYFYILQKGKKYGVYNIKTRRQALPFWVKERSEIDIQGNYIVVRQKGKYGLYSSDARELLPAKYSSINLLCAGSDVFEVYEGEKYGFYDGRIEKLLVEPIEGNLTSSEIDDRFYSLYYEGIQTYIDINTGKPVLSLDYNFSGELNKKRYMTVEYKGKIGIYDFEELKLIVQCTYKDIVNLKEEEMQYFD